MVRIRPTVVRTIVPLVCAVTLLGCGGGGGTSPGAQQRELGDACQAGATTAVLAYSTQWGSSPSSASQIVQIVGASGLVVRSDSINRAGDSASSIEMTAVPAGVYEVRATLYASANATGAVLGVASQVVDLCAGRVSVSTTRATAQRSLEARPREASLREGQSKRYIATARDGAGSAVFLPASSVAWSVTGGIASVDGTGLVKAVKPGAGQVRASNSQGAFVANSKLTVEKFTPVRTKWTVLVYMNAASDLHPASVLNMNQLERVAGNPQVRYVVQWKQTKARYPASSFDGVRRYLVRQDDSNAIASEVIESDMVDGQGFAVDMGLAQTLREFVQWGKQNYPSDRTVLVLWSHGNGWSRRPESEGRAFSYDDQYGTAIQIWELQGALAGLGVDVIAWDASLMQQLEVAYELRGLAKYVVGSEESPPADGYPYDKVFRVFRDGPDKATEVLCRAFVDATVSHPPYATRKITQSVLDTARLAPLASALDSLGLEMATHVGSLGLAVPSVRSLAQSYSPNNVRHYYDLVDLCHRLEADARVPGTVKAAAALVRARAAEAVVYEGHNNQSPRSNGISVDFSPGSVFSGRAVDYSRLELAAHTSWDEWLSMAP